MVCVEKWFGRWVKPYVYPLAFCLQRGFSYCWLHFTCVSYMDGSMSAQETLFESWDPTMWPHTFKLLTIVYLGQVPIPRGKAHRVPCSGLRARRTARRKRGHKPRTWRWLNVKQSDDKSLYKVLDKEDLLFFPWSLLSF